MKLGMDLKRGRNWTLTCWMSDVSPASGMLSIGAEFNGTSAQLIMLNRGKVQWVSGPWLNHRFQYIREDLYPQPDAVITYNYTSNEDEKYFNLVIIDPTIFSPISPMVTPESFSFSTYSVSDCKLKDSESQGGCLKYDFNRSLECRKPFYSVDVDRNRGLFSGGKDGYIHDEMSKMSLYDCKQICWKNCSCIAFTYAHPINKTGCLTYDDSSGHFIANYGGSEYYFFLKRDKGIKWWIWLLVGVGSFIILIICCLVGRRLHVIGKTNAAKKMLFSEVAGNNDTTPSTQDSNIKKKKKKKVNQELQLFSFHAISAATNNFSSTNKLGEGGFGAVYKGTLFDGKDIAVKRLSKNSGQGDKEFKNEIQLIAKLQHKNLVRLLGCCIEKEEKLLVYEYMPNFSLDFFIFDPSKKDLLDWKNRFMIIEGIAQGLLYLHKYSRLTVIHRDLKASNILLDEGWNPKISDFGLAKIFGFKDCEANTSRVVGTRGYMSPEYMIQGIVSMKTDVFSFGVLLLEIVSGKMNNGTYDREHPLNLIGLAWEMWKEGRSFELMDSSLEESCCHNEVIRCIHVGLLCVQDHAIDRPSMNDVVSMITNENMKLPTPKRPAFFIERTEKEIAKEENLENGSINKLTLSIVKAR